MFDGVVIVDSAISAFNNAALYGAAFLWCAVLAVPLFAVVYLCRDAIIQKLGWNQNNILQHVSVWTAGLTFLWVVLFGGNYGVLRDGLSVLPGMMAMIVFLTSLFVSSYLRKIALPRMNWWKWIILLLVIGITGWSDTHVWWGPLLQIGAMMFGIMLGRFAKAEMRPVGGIVLIVLSVVIAMLMQPEFFRFGQLGNLTVGHVLWMLVLGGMSMATIATLNINARGKIKRGIFIKLKWMCRVMCVLGAALFIITEALPIFLGMLAALFIMFAMSVWHEKQVDLVVGYKMFALVLVCFGVITVMPAISAMGILYWASLPKVDFWSKFKILL